MEHISCCYLCNQDEPPATRPLVRGRLILMQDWLPLVFPNPPWLALASAIHNDKGIRARGVQGLHATLELPPNAHWREEG